MIFVGIDPGLDGAAAAIDNAGRVLALHDTPTGAVGKRRDYLLADMERLLRECCLCFCKPFRNDPDRVVAAIERVHSMPKQGVVSSFTFGKGYGLWLGLLAGLHVPTDLVDPVRWKKSLLADMGRDKDASRVRAQQLFPEADLKLKKHHGRAEALLIAEYRRRQG